jgi:HK97 family phage major capsid protein
MNVEQMKELEQAMRVAFDEMKGSHKSLRDEFTALEQKLARHPSAGGDGGASNEGRIAELVMKDAGFEALRGQKLRDLRIAIPGGLGIKTQIINASGASQPLVAADRLAEIIAPGMQRLTLRDLIPSNPTTSNRTEFTQETAYTNAARPQGDASPGGVEGEPFAESGFTFTLASAAVVTLGHWVPASVQVLDDAAALGDFLQNRLLYGLKLEEDQEILTADGSAGQLDGLCDQATAYNRGSTNDTLLDTLAKAKTQLELSNYFANGVVLNPVDFLTMVTAKDSQLRYVYGDPKLGAIPTVWGVPIVVSNSMTSGKFLMADFLRAARIRDRQEAMVEFSTGYQDFFVKHLVAIKAWERLALEVHRATAMVYGDCNHAG